jgi:hypothetical protein
VNVDPRWGMTELAVNSVIKIFVFIISLKDGGSDFNGTP